MFSVKVTQRKNFLPHLEKRLKALRKQKVEIGFFQEQGIHAGSGLSYGTLQYIHEYGSNAAGIPARPLFTDTARVYYYKQNVKHIKKLLVKYFSNIKRKSPPIKAQMVLDQIGGAWVRELRGNYGDTGKFESNAPSTIRQKGFDAPLYETGELRDNVAFRASINGNVVVP